MPSLIHCIYSSAAARPFDMAELVELLRQAREKNQRLGLTGMLLHAEGSFFQVLEGPADVVDAVYAGIGLDPRHCQVTRIIHEAIPKRVFDTWTMGFSSLSRQDLADVSDGNDFFGEARCFVGIGPGRAKKLLAAFAEGRWRQTLGGARHVAGAGG